VAQYPYTESSKKDKYTICYHGNMPVYFRGRGAWYVRKKWKNELLELNSQWWM